MKRTRLDEYDNEPEAAYLRLHPEKVGTDEPPAFVVERNVTTPKQDIPTVWIGVRNGCKAFQIDWERLDGLDWYGAGPLKCHSHNHEPPQSWILLLDGKPVGRAHATLQGAMRNAQRFTIIRERLSR